MAVLTRNLEAVVPQAEEPVSPELALVDPELARRERSRLGPVGDVPSAHELPSAREKGARAVSTNGLPHARPERSQAVEPPSRSHEDGYQAPRRRLSRLRRLPRWLRALGLASIALLTVAGLTTIPIDQPSLERGTPAQSGPSSSNATGTSSGASQASGSSGLSPSASSPESTPSATASPARSGARASSPSTATTSKQKPQPTRPKDSRRAKPAGTNRARPSAPAPKGRRFAWAPVAGARAYEVAFYRGDAIVFVERTTSPVIELPARWRHQGQLLSLAPGAYRWYVWTIGRDGRRGDAAVVQARLVVPSR